MTSRIMKDLLQLSLKEEIGGLTNLDMDGLIYDFLSNEEVEELAGKINLLPAEYRNILFFRFCFNNSPYETDKILEIENSIGKLKYIERSLADLMGLKDLWIDNVSMKRACDLALMEEMKEYDKVQILGKPSYSKDFRRKLKYIKVNKNQNNWLLSMGKRASIFILVSILSFSAVLTVNAGAREKVFTWIIERFEEYSIFTRKISERDNPGDFGGLKINYIPVGFELKKTHQGRSMLIYEYSNSDNQELTIKFIKANSNGKSYYDTENAEIEEFTFGNSKAFTWQTDTNTYFISDYSGMEYHISGQINKGEILKIAENISK